jgi:glycosyltransferase involved in cell wall biosynthesis
MRIGVDCRSLQEPHPTGVSVYTRELVRALVQLPESRQHEFVLFLNGTDLRSPHTATSRRVREMQHGIEGKHVQWRVRHMPNKLFTTLQITGGVPSAEWMFGDVDLVFVPNLQFFPFRRSRIPYVLTVHDISFALYPECLSVWGRMRHSLLQPRSFIEHAARITTVSGYTQQDVMREYGIEKQKIEVIYPGVTVPDAFSHQRTGEQSPSLPDSALPKKYIVSLATLEPRKNIDALIAAFRQIRMQHPDVELVLVGARGLRHSPRRTSMVNEEGIRYLGYVDDITKWSVLQQAVVFVYPSLYEGFGFPPLEAQAAGVPVIVGHHSSLPEVLGNSALYADVLDVHSLTRAIHGVLSDATLASTLRTQGLHNIHRFDWQHSARQTLQLFTSLHH